MALYVGIDLGTSGCRATAINDNADIVAESTMLFTPVVNAGPGQYEQDPHVWWQSLLQVMHDLLEKIAASEVLAISVDGTSSSLLVCDQQGKPSAPALMYNDSRCQQQAGLISQHAPADSPAHGPGSSLAKLLYLHANYPEARYALHQSDWIIGKLSGQFGISDENNALKLGFTPGASDWPQWVTTLSFNRQLLPRVYPPGTVIGPIDKQLSISLGLNPQALIVTGTTDSTAAFLATGAHKTGQAVTSLGSTLVTKIISDKPINSRQHGVYSHRIFAHWLAGGASNSGGAALLTFFSIDEMHKLTPLLNPDEDTGLDYYPLPAPGERFPIADPHMQPRLPQKIPEDPESRAIIFQGLLEGISRIEAQSYALLQQLGAPGPEIVLTAGGGSGNIAWNRIRERYLGVPVLQAQHHQASYGVALLARHGILKTSPFE